MSDFPVTSGVEGRAALTDALMNRTGLDDEVLTQVVHRFYDKIRKDAVLGPIFNERITDWDPHLERMVAFWSSVALMTGRYHGTPMMVHLKLPVGWSHFERWLGLFRETTHEICTPEGAELLMDRAERIARSLNMGIETTAARRRGDISNLRP